MEITSIIAEILEKDGVYGTARFLNSLTPHRFTGIYRYDGDVLRNVCLYDQFDPSVKLGDDVAMENAYCANVGLCGNGIEFSDINSNDSLKTLPGSPVVSYCGALVVDNEGKPYGTLCHFDIDPCDRTGDLPLLERIAPLVYKSLVQEGLPVAGGPISTRRATE